MTDDRLLIPMADLPENAIDATDVGPKEHFGVRAPPNIFITQE